MKRNDTITIESVLLNSCYGPHPSLAKEYSTNEVTLHKPGMTNGKEFVDFMSYNPVQNIIRCYEIKVTMNDFHSDAKKSWYGDYNYLVLSSELHSQKTLDWWKSQIPNDVGIIVINPETLYKDIVFRAKKRDISDEQRIMLKESLLRSLFYQNLNKNWYLRDMRKR